MWAQVLLFALGAAQLGRAANITLYNVVATTTTTAAADATYTGLAAYDTTVLSAPAAPDPPTTALTVSIPIDVWGSGNLLSIKQKGNFLGLSVELSVAENVLGSDAGSLKPIFLNYLANIRNRAGAGVLIRVGGNTQEKSTILVDGLSDGSSIDKMYNDGDTVTTTPIINYSLELLYTMGNISALTDTAWFFGLSFNESAVQSQSPNVPLAAHWAQTILGDYLLGTAMGNEPDLYVDHSDRDGNWTVNDYYNEFQTMRDDILSQGDLLKTQFLMGPSVCCQTAGFDVVDVFNTGWLTDNLEYLSHVTVQHYPTNNCQINGNVIDAQSIFPDFLNHTNPREMAALYTASAQEVVAQGKEILMLETNTASCGGFAGLSDSFGAAMWMVDWSLQLAYTNFSAALMHVGGQNVYYNPFTPPPGKYKNYGWTTGSIYYSALIVAEVFGSSNNSQIIDLWPAADFFPQYIIYEDGLPVRAVLFNYVTDGSGGSDYTANLSFNGSTIGDTVSVRYFRAASVSEQINITWAGQTMGGYQYASDGRLSGELTTEQVTCSNGECAITVPAPSIAVVFFTDQALADSSVPDDAVVSYSTSIIGSGKATIAAGAMITGNGIAPPKWIYTSAATRSQQVQIGVGVLAVTAAIALGVARGTLSL